MTKSTHPGRKRVEAAAERVVAATQARDKAITEAREAGATLRDLAAWTGLNHETVRTIIKRQKETSDAS